MLFVPNQTFNKVKVTFINHLQEVYQITVIAHDVTMRTILKDSVKFRKIVLNVYIIVYKHFTRPERIVAMTPPVVPEEPCWVTL